ncbi:MAG: triose-phosphate isomerase, partial [Thermoleophilia bacterium]|nr:triose-phosphate isomerase [Thermoleophilia bacterium]
MSRRPLVAGNWKMFKTRAEARAFAETLAANLAQAEGVELAICPPFTSIDVVAT